MTNQQESDFLLKLRLLLKEYDVSIYGTMDGTVLAQTMVNGFRHEIVELYDFNPDSLKTYMNKEYGRGS